MEIQYKSAILLAGLLLAGTFILFLFAGFFNIGEKEDKMFDCYTSTKGTTYCGGSKDAKTILHYNLNNKRWLIDFGEDNL